MNSQSGTEGAGNGGTLADFVGRTGTVVGISPWMLVDQKRIDGFADVTEDHQFLHVDSRAAAAGPFGSTIAHGFLSLSLLSRMAETALPQLGGVSASVNYGFDRVRFLAPVPSGARVRGRFTLEKVTERPGGQVLVQYKADVEIEGGSKPALSADWLVLMMFDSKEN